MKLTTRGRYAVMALLELAAYEGTAPLTLSVIAERQQLSLSYLELLFGKLRRCGLVSSVRGPGGGYVLAQQSERISIAQIVEVVDQVSADAQDDDWSSESGFNGFLDQFLWNRLNEQMLQYLRGVSLADLLAQHAEMLKVSAARCAQSFLSRPSPLVSVMRLAS